MYSAQGIFQHHFECKKVRTILDKTRSPFTFSLIIEGATEKVLQFETLRKTDYNMKLGFHQIKMYFEHHSARLKQEK